MGPLFLAKVAALGDLRCATRGRQELRRNCGQDYIDEGRYFYTIVIKKKWFGRAHHGHPRENFIEGKEFWQDEKY
jgi:hypothetical protein